MLLWVIKHRREAEAPVPGTLFLPLDKIKRYSEPPIGVISFFFPFWGCEGFRHLLLLDFLPILSRVRVEKRGNQLLFTCCLQNRPPSKGLRSAIGSHCQSCVKKWYHLLSELSWACVLRLFFIFYHWNCC